MDHLHSRPLVLAISEEWQPDCSSCGDEHTPHQPFFGLHNTVTVPLLLTLEVEGASLLSLVEENLEIQGMSRLKVMVTVRCTPCRDLRHLDCE